MSTPLPSHQQWPWKSEAARKWYGMSARVMKWVLEARARGNHQRAIRLHMLANSLSTGAVEHERIVRAKTINRAAE